MKSMSSPVRHLLKFNLNINFPVHTDFERNRFYISSKLVIYDQTIFEIGQSEKKGPNRSPTSQSCHQHISYLTLVINIDVADMIC